MKFVEDKPQSGELGTTGQRIYDFIRESHETTGLVPTVREIREAVGVSSIGTVGYWLDKLEALDLIRREGPPASPKGTMSQEKEIGATGQKIYDFIREWHAATGLVPTVREIREAIGARSTRTVGYWLDKLEALNLIRRDAGKNRSIRLPAESPNVPVPLVGDICVSSPNLAEELVDANFVLPRQLVGEGALVMLRVRGDSKIDAQIAHDDYVVVREQSTAQNGDIVAALVPGTEDGATIKYFSRKAGRVCLLPANKAYKPIPLGPDGRILGKVVTVLRRV
jgi:repressor LexA